MSARDMLLIAICGASLIQVIVGAVLVEDLQDRVHRLELVTGLVTTLALP